MTRGWEYFAVLRQALPMRRQPLGRFGIDDTQRSLSEQGFSRLDSRRGKFCLQGGGEVVILTERDGRGGHYCEASAAEFREEHTPETRSRSGSAMGAAPVRGFTDAAAGSAPASCC